ncbi:MAG: transporter substrate-binding domain-containing protein [Gammaproteobacteria bacterium]|nr:transporter substrate-binding domain-containing protein [Gammaproteobacteria bacterium]
MATLYPWSVTAAPTWPRQAWSSLTARRREVRFSVPYLQVRQQLVYRHGSDRPEDMQSLNGSLGVVADSSHEELLSELAGQHAGLEWTAYPHKTQHELLEMISAGELDYAVVNSNEFNHARRYYPDTAVAFDPTDELDVAWAFSRQTDRSLYLAANQYPRQIAARW